MMARNDNNQDDNYVLLRRKVKIDYLRETDEQNSVKTRKRNFKGANHK